MTTSKYEKDLKEVFLGKTFTNVQRMSDCAPPVYFRDDGAWCCLGSATEDCPEPELVCFTHQNPESILNTPITEIHVRRLFRGDDGGVTRVVVMLHTEDDLVMYSYFARGKHKIDDLLVNKIAGGPGL